MQVNKWRKISVQTDLLFEDSRSQDPLSSQGPLRFQEPLRYQDSQSSHISSSSQISRSSETSWSCQIHHQHCDVCDVLWSSVARQLLLSSSNAEENILYGCCKVWTQAWQKHEINISRRNTKQNWEKCLFNQDKSFKLLSEDTDWLFDD